MTNPITDLDAYTHQLGQRPQASFSVVDRSRDKDEVGMRWG
jgi:hypothetical protein